MCAAATVYFLRPVPAEHTAIERVEQDRADARPVPRARPAWRTHAVSVQDLRDGVVALALDVQRAHAQDDLRLFIVQHAAHGRLALTRSSRHGRRLAAIADVSGGIRLPARDGPGLGAPSQSIVRTLTSATTFPRGEQRVERRPHLA